MKRTLNGYESNDYIYTAAAEALAAEVFKKNGDFRKSKPKNASGDAKYVWRMVAFFAGIRPEMPVTADFDLDDYYWNRTSERAAERRAHTKYLDTLVDEILAAFPRKAEKGTMRWGRALGKA